MTNNAQIATADIADRHRSMLATAALSMSLMFLTRAVTHLVGPPLNNNLRYLVAGFAVLAVCLVAPTVAWKFRILSKLPQGERDAYFSPDGFVNDIFNRAQRVSWTVTFFVLLLLDVVVFDKDSGGYFTTLPPVFYFQFLLALMFGVLASVFLVLNRADGTDDAKDGALA